MQTKTVAVLGLGVFGCTVAKQLSFYQCDVLAIDEQEENVRLIADDVTKAVVGDMTDHDFLEAVGVGQCDVVVIAAGNSLESSVLATMHCRKLGVPRIIAKAHSSTFEQVLFALGVDSVVTPEKDMGRDLASKILRNHLEEVLQLDGETSVIEFEIPEKWVGKTMVELDLRRRYELNILGTRTERGGKLNARVSAVEPLQENTIMVALAGSHIFEQYDYQGLLNE